MSKLRQWVKRRKLIRSGLFCIENGLSALRPGLTSTHPRVGSSSDFFFSAMIRVKDEARFMPEWISHHLQIGVEHVFIYDNNSGDGLERILKPFTDASLVTIMMWPTVPIAPSCYNDFVITHGHRSKWVAFFDADEFLFERTPGSTLRILQHCSTYPAVAINWRYFGSSWYETIPKGLVTGNFTLADAYIDEHVKVIAQPSLIRRYRNPHNFLYHYGRLARTPEGRRVFGTWVPPADDPELLLHHYVYRSREDYDRKARRTYATAVGAKSNIRNPKRSDREFERHNRIVVPPSPDLLRRTEALLRKFHFGQPFVVEAGTCPAVNSTKRLQDKSSPNA